VAYYLTRFGNVILPLVHPITEMPTMTGVAGGIQTLGGGFDNFGDGIVPAQFPLSIQYRVTVIGAIAADYVTAVNALRVMGRTRAYLQRLGQDGSGQRASARCRQVRAIDTVESFNAIELVFDFELWSHWHNNWVRGWLLDAGYELDTGLVLDSVADLTPLTGSPQTVSVTNGGNVLVSDAIVTITAGNAALTAVAISCAAQGVKWTWTGAGVNPNIAAGKSLIVDCGALSVKDDGADAFVYFALDAAHTARSWLQLAPGANNVIVTWTGGGTGSTIDFAFDWNWA
jgi:hypothetical protein